MIAWVVPGGCRADHGVPHRRRAHRLARLQAQAAADHRRARLAAGRRRGLRRAAAELLAGPRARAGRAAGHPRRHAAPGATGPFLRIPQLAIHLDRKVNDGLVLDKQRHMSRSGASATRQADLLGHLAARAGAAVDRRDRRVRHGDRRHRGRRHGSGRRRVLRLRPDGQPGVGARRAARAARTPRPRPTAHVAVLAAFDHEELGSASRSGARGPLLADVLAPDRRRARRRPSQRRAAFAGVVVRVGRRRGTRCTRTTRSGTTRPTSRCLGGGPLLKINANQRYATDAHGAALWRRAVRRRRRPVPGVRLQQRDAVRLDDRADHRDPARHPDRRRRRRRSCRCTRPASSAAPTTRTGWRR